jgi:acyl carrier protein phosphodiesterase
VLANAAAVEALANRYFICLDRLAEFDQLKPMSKIEALADIAGETIDWGRSPWQQVARLIRVRNWLAHYKEARGDTELVGMAGHRSSKFDPAGDLSWKAIRDYYKATREGFASLGRDLRLDESEFGFLETEEYRQPL